MRTRGVMISPAVRRAELHRALHQLGGVGVEGALVGGARRSGEASSVELRAERSSSCGSMPEAPHDRVGRAVEQPDRPPVDGGEAALEAPGWRGRSPSAGRSRGSWAPARRRCIVSRRAERQPDAEGQRADRALGQPDGRRAGRVDQVGDGRLGEEADRQVGDGDADLGAGELGRQRRAGRAARPRRRRRPSAAARSTATAVDGDEGELRGDEHTRGQRSAAGRRRASHRITRPIRSAGGDMSRPWAVRRVLRSGLESTTVATRCAVGRRSRPLDRLPGSPNSAREATPSLQARSPGPRAAP